MTSGRSRVLYIVAGALFLITSAGNAWQIAARGAEARYVIPAVAFAVSGLLLLWHALRRRNRETE